MAVDNKLEQSPGSTMTDTEIEAAQQAMNQETGIIIHHFKAMFLDKQETYYTGLG